MILRRLGVTNWRGLLQVPELGPFSQHVNVIHAPNASGKSSLFEALRSGLFDSHSVGGTDIEAVRPWGRDLSPTVFVEFSERETTYRIEKRFLSDAFARLLRLEDGRFQPIAEGRQADVRLREILAAEGPQRGVSKPEHWGIAQVLWAPQGDLRLVDLGKRVDEMLRMALNGQIAAAGTGQLEKRIAAHFEKYFTKTGKLKSGQNAPPIVALQEESQRLREQRDELKQQQIQFEEASNQVLLARNRGIQARRDAEALRKKMEQTQAAADQWNRLRTELRKDKEEAERARERYEAITRREEEICLTRDEIGKLEHHIAEAEARRDGLAEELAAASSELERKQLDRERAKVRPIEVEMLRNQIDDARQFLESWRDVQTLDVRMQRIRERETSLTAARETRATIVAPDDKTLREIRRGIRERDTARAALAAAQIHLTVTPDERAVLQTLTDDHRVEVVPPESVTISGDRLVEVRIEGFGRVRAAGPEGDTQANRAAMEAAEQRLKQLCEPFATFDLELLEQRHALAEQADREIRELQRDLDHLLGDESRDALAERHAAAKARFGRLGEKYPAWLESAPDIDELQTTVTQREREIRERLDHADSALRAQQDSVKTLEQQLLTCETQLSSDRVQLETTRARLQRHVDDEQRNTERAGEKGNSLLRWRAAEEAVKRHEEALAGIPSDPAMELTTLQRQLHAYEDASAKVRDDEKHAEGQLHALAAAGVHSQCVACEERLAEVTAKMEREELRMRAAKLLHETVLACHESLAASIAAPLEQAASRMLARVAGPRLGQVHLTAGFLPDSVHPELSPERIALENLSGGEQEQLQLIVRLALAEVLARDQRQLVVLDDALTATDSGRLARLLAIIEEASARLQIVILTCHPERYSGLEKATFMELTR